MNQPGIEGEGLVEDTPRTKHTARQRPEPVDERRKRRRSERKDHEEDNTFHGEILLLQGEVKKKSQIAAHAAQDALMKVRQKKHRMQASPIHRRLLQQMEEDLQRILELCQRMDRRRVDGV